MSELVIHSTSNSFNTFCEIVKPLATIDTLPVSVWRRIIEYLQEPKACSLTCKRLRILIIKDPSADLEKMYLRTAVHLKKTYHVFPKQGPTRQFLTYSQKMSLDTSLVDAQDKCGILSRSSNGD